METRVWNAHFAYEVGEFPKVTFRGRNPFSVSDPRHKSELLNLGVFEELPTGELKYIGRACFKCIDGSVVEIDKEGKATFDITKLKTGFKNRLDEEFLMP